MVCFSSGGAAPRITSSRTGKDCSPTRAWPIAAATGPAHAPREAAGLAGAARALRRSRRVQGRSRHPPGLGCLNPSRSPGRCAGYTRDDATRRAANGAGRSSCNQRQPQSRQLTPAHVAESGKQHQRPVARRDRIREPDRTRAIPCTVQARSWGQLSNGLTGQP
jgi:hypothetical protein